MYREKKMNNGINEFKDFFTAKEFDGKVKKLSLEEQKFVYEMAVALFVNNEMDFVGKHCKEIELIMDKMGF